jgi:hypothetical protein
VGPFLFKAINNNKKREGYEYIIMMLMSLTKLSALSEE